MALFDRPILMWVTDRRRSDAPLPELAGQLDGCVDLIQVRERGLDRLPLELLVRAICTVVGTGAHVVINGDLALAKHLGAGVHLPEAGPSIEEARECLGSTALIGRSVHTPDPAARSVGADYLVAGHVYETGSKPDRPPIGLAGLAGIVAVAPAPVLAIGGVTPERVPKVLSAGAAGVAVLSPLTQLTCIREIAASYRSALEQSVTDRDNATITATINGKAVELPAGTTISAFLAGRELHERLVVVERNGEIVKRALFPDLVIEHGDLLEIVHFVGGG
jgi:thiamine biosynthesis protein ThiS